MNLPRLFVAVAILAPGIAISQVSPRGVRAHERETAEVRRLGVGPGVRPDARRTGMLAQRPSSPHGGEGNPVAPPRARSPLDQLDPKQIPAAEQFAWQPKGLVAVLGEHGVRHWSYVTQTAFAASGKFVVSEGWGGGLRLWDAATMQLKLWRHPARAFAISPNGKQLAVAEEREVIRVYDLDGATLRERLVLRKKNHAVFWESSPSITFAPDGQGLAVKYVDLEDFDRPIKQRKGKDVYVLWRWEKGKVREEELPRRRGSGRGVFALDGKIFLHAGSGSRLYLWNVGLKTPELRAVLERIDSFAVSPDGKLLVARRVDGAALWDMSAVPPKELTTMDTGNAAVKAFSPDGQLLACLNEDQLLLVSMGDVKRQIERKRALAVPREVKLPFRARVLSFSPDGHRLAFGGWDGSVRLWDVVNGRAVFPVRGPCGAVAAVQFSADGRTLATAGEDGNLRLWGLGGGRPRETFVTQFEPDSAPKALAVTAGGELLALATPGQSKVRVWDLRARRPEPLLSLPPGREDDEIGGLVFDPNESRLIVFGARQTNAEHKLSQTALASWKIDVARRRADQEGLDLTGRLGESSKVCASVAAFSGDGRRLAFATEYAVHVWEWGTRRQEVATFKAHNRVVYGVALSPDGSELATCGYDDEEDPKGENISGDRVHVWRLGGKEPVCTAAFAVKGAQRLDFALGGAALLVSEDGGGCVLLDKKTGKRLWQWKPPAGYTRFAVAPDRRHVALANSNGTIYIVRLKGPDKP